MEYDLIIVGSGSVGSAAGYYAAKSGCRVLMMDSHTPPHRNGTHHGATRINRRAYGEGSKYLPLGLRSQELWSELAKMCDYEIMKPCGVLNMGPKHSPFIINAQASARIFNLDTEILPAKEVRNRWPGFTPPEDYVAVYESNIGLLRCEAAVDTFIKLSKKAGAEHLFNITVTALQPIESGVEVATTAGKYRSRKVLVSAGSWVKKLLPNLPVNVLRKVFMWHDADEGYKHIPSFIIEMDGDIYYGIPADENGLKIGKHNNNGCLMNSKEDYVPFGGRPEDRTETLEYLTRFMPGVGEVLRGETCMYDMSPDEDFIIDTLPTCERVLFMTGFSGHGFKFVPALGEMTAMFARDEEYPIDLSSFSLKRFSFRCAL